VPAVDAEEAQPEQLRRRVALPAHIALVEPIERRRDGELWSARDRRRGVDVVLKVVGPSGSDRLEAEARALSRLAPHPGIVTLAMVGRGDQGTTWIVTDLAHRGTLEGCRGLPVPQLLGFGAAVADALAHAHRLGVVHGDVTPSNVFIDANGQAVLGDFGAAGLVDPRIPDQSGQAVVPTGHTPTFASPERRGGAPATSASDVYGLGATIAWVLGDSAPRPVRGILGRCTAADPHRRPTAATVARRLGRWSRR